MAAVQFVLERLRLLRRRRPVDENTPLRIDPDQGHRRENSSMLFAVCEKLDFNAPKDLYHR
jgi:hypothetical protein